MSDLEINFNLTAIMQIYDEFFLQTTEDIKNLFDDIYDTNIPIEKIKEFMNTNTNEVKLKQKHGVY
jgi:hypothetical protein